MKKPQHVTSNLVLVTPQMAKKWLEKNTNNIRPTIASNVETFMRLLREGTFKITHQGIAFDEKGVLVDGQHRLTAILRTGISTYLQVTHGLTTMQGIDEGCRRTAAQINGLSPRHAQVLRPLWLYERGSIDVFRAKLTAPDQSNLLGRHEEDFAAVFSTWGRHKIFKGVDLAALVWALPVAPGPVSEFAERYLSGEMLIKGEPASLLRQWRLTHTSRVSVYRAEVLARVMFNALAMVVEKKGAKSKLEMDSSGYWEITRRRRILGLIAPPPKFSVVSETADDWRLSTPLQHSSNANAAE